jgi:O-antigen ligase
LPARAERPKAALGLSRLSCSLPLRNSPGDRRPGLLLGYDVTPKLAIVYLAAAILLLYSGRWWPGAARSVAGLSGRLFYLLLLAQSASLVLSAALSHDPILAVGGTAFARLGALTQIVILFVVAVLAAQVSIRPAFTRRLLIAIEVCAAIAGIYGILQYLGWDPLLPPRLYTCKLHGRCVRPPATLRHAMYFANFLLPVILIAAALAIHEARVAWRRFHLGVLSIAAAALLLTGTRSAVLGLMVGGILFGFIEARRIGKKRMLAYTAVCALACAAFVSLLAFSPAGRSFRVRLAQWVQDSAGGTRLLVWRDSWPLIANHWLAGIGPETFAGEFRRLQSLQLSRAYPDRYHEDPHNLMISVAVSQGVAGLALVSGLIALGLVCAYRCVRRGVPEGAMLAAAIVAMTISEQFAPLTVTNALYFYLPTALAVALAAPAGESAHFRCDPCRAGASRQSRPDSGSVGNSGSRRSIPDSGCLARDSGAPAGSRRRTRRPRKLPARPPVSVSGGLPVVFAADGFSGPLAACASAPAGAEPPQERPAPRLNEAASRDSARSTSPPS